MGASMASNIYHPLTAFYFILVAVIWYSASVTRRFADRSYFAFRTSVLAFSLTDRPDNRHSSPQHWKPP